MAAAAQHKFIHSVYFWLKDGLSDADRAAFRGGLESLSAIASVEALYVGTPVPSERPVVDGSYSFGLTVVLADSAAHDHYQADPIHRRFVDAFKGHWNRIQIYDFA